MTEREKIVLQISEIISNFDFPLFIVQDVNKRLMDCQEVGYAKQQLRYLQNVKKAMLGGLRMTDKLISLVNDWWGGIE